MDGRPKRDFVLNGKNPKPESDMVQLGGWQKNPESLSQERFHEMKDEVSKLANETQDHGLYRPALEHIL